MPSVDTTKSSKRSPYLPEPSKDGIAPALGELPTHSVALKQLHCCWQFLELCQLLWILQSSLKLKSYTLSEMEAALVDSGTENGILDEIISKLLLKSHHRARLGVGEGLPSSWWEIKLQANFGTTCRTTVTFGGRLQVVVGKWFTELEKLHTARETEQCEWDDKQQERLQVLTNRISLLSASTTKTKDPPTKPTSPLAGCCFRQLAVVSKVHLLRAVISWGLEDQRDAQLLNALRELEHDDLRIESVGRDTAGNAYFYFPQFFKDARLYRQRAGGKSTVPNKPPPHPKFELWVKGFDSFKNFLDELKQSRKKNDRELYGALEEVMELVTREHAAHLKKIVREKEEKEREARILAGSMRRSGRVATVQSQQAGMHKQKQQVLQQWLQARLATLSLKAFTANDISSSDSDQDEESDEDEDDEEEQQLHRQKLAKKRRDELEKKRKLEEERQRQEQEKKRRLDQGAERERRAKLRKGTESSEEDGANNTEKERRKSPPKGTRWDASLTLGPEITLQYALAGEWKVFKDGVPSKARNGFKVYVSPSGGQVASLRGAREAGFEGEPGAA